MKLITLYYLQAVIFITTSKNCVNYVHVDILTRISKTWLTSFPLISMPFISNISSPSDKSPLRSAAPPRTIRLITTLSISFRTVAPYRKHTERQWNDAPTWTWLCVAAVYYLQYTGPREEKSQCFAIDNRDSNKWNENI